MKVVVKMEQTSANRSEKKNIKVDHYDVKIPEWLALNICTSTRAAASLFREHVHFPKKLALKTRFV